MCKACRVRLKHSWDNNSWTFRGEELLGSVRDFEKGFYIRAQIESLGFFRSDLVLWMRGFDENTIYYEGQYHHTN